MKDMLKKIVTGAAGAILALVIVALAEILGGWVTNLFGSSQTIPAGAVVAYLGKEPAPPKGWRICGLHDDELDFEGRFLVGTYDPSKVGDETGSETHTHQVTLTSTGEVNGRSVKAPDGADNNTGFPNWNHEHRIDGPTLEADHTPRAVKVQFFCKL